MPNLTQQVFSSSFFMLFSQLLQKSIGLISTLILARLLIPEDFGIIAFLSITLNLFKLLSESGSYQYIVSKTEINDNDLNTVWTLNIILRGALCSLLIFFAPTVVSFFNMDEALNALYIMSFILLLHALRNPGFDLYRRNLNYKLFFKLEVLAKIISFFVVITWAFISPSFWALVAGELTLGIVTLVGTFVLHTYRPKLSLHCFSEQWAFSKWMFLKGILGFLKSNLDQLFITKYFPASMLGGYYMAKDVCLMAATQGVKPATDPLLASFSKVKNDNSSFQYQASLSLFIVNLVALPLALYLYLFSEHIVYIFLGNKWLEIVPIFSNFSLLMYFLCLNPVLTNMCTAMHKVKSIFYIDLICVIFVILSLFLLRNSGLELIALVRGAIQGAIVLLLIFYVRLHVKFSLINSLKLFLSVLIPGLISCLIAIKINTYYLDISFFSFILVGISFVSSYALLFIIFSKVFISRLEEMIHLKSIFDILLNRLPFYNK